MRVCIFCAILEIPIIFLVLKCKPKTEKTWWVGGEGDELYNVGSHASLWQI